MAIFHSHVQIVTRGKGKSAVAAAAYRAGTIITNERDGITHDYLHKKGVVYTEILLPDHAPEEYKNRAILWNAVEKIEKSTNSQLARELDIALPKELTREQGIALAREYVKTAFVDEGMIADLCVHDKGDENPHFHVMLTMRPLNEDGTWGVKHRKEYILDDAGNKIYNPKTRQYKCRSVPTTDWHDRGNADKWRKIWEDMANAALEKYGHDSRIDRRSYAEQGIELIPTVHLGAAVIQMEKKGIRTERGDINRKAADINAEIRSLNARIVKTEKWPVEYNAKPETPSLIAVIEELSRREGIARGTRLHNLVDVANFLIRNQITDFEELESKVSDMHGQLSEMRGELKKVDRRIEMLKKHIAQSVNYKQYRSYKKRFNELRTAYEEAKKATGFGAKRKAENALKALNEFRNAQHDKLAKFDEADKYLRDVLQSRFDPNKLPPIKKWENELAEKLEKRDVLIGKHKSLKDETQKVEQIKRSVERILSGDTSEFTAADRIKSHSIEPPKDKPSILDMIRKISQMQESELKHMSKQASRKSYDTEL